MAGCCLITTDLFVDCYNLIGTSIHAMRLILVDAIMHHAINQRGSIMKKTINTAARSITFTFDELEPVTLALDKVSADNITYATLHGFAARVGDSAALTKSAENNFTVTEAMRRAEVEAMVKFYENTVNTDWNMRVATPKAAPINPAIQAIATKLGKTYAEAMAWYNEKLMAELAAM
jgi:hypothetical protein